MAVSTTERERIWSVYDVETKQHGTINCVCRTPSGVEQHIQCSCFQSFLDYWKNVLWKVQRIYSQVTKTLYEYARHHWIRNSNSTTTRLITRSLRPYKKVSASSKMVPGTRKMQKTEYSTPLYLYSSSETIFTQFTIKYIQMKVCLWSSLGKCHS
jgi:hypothetical protein